MKFKYNLLSSALLSAGLFSSAAQAATVTIDSLTYGTNENGTGNCMIRRIEQVKDEEKGIVTTRTTYPSGNNFDYGDTWSERDNYEYMYAKSK